MNALVETHWLAQNLKDPQIIIVDASPTEEYVSMHIPGAVSCSFGAEEYLSYGINTSYGGGVDLFTDPKTSLPFQDGPPEYIQDVLQKLGVNKNSLVVIYDNGANFLATRVFWTLSYHGHKKAVILNGGLEKWAKDGYPLTSEVVRPKKGDFLVNVFDEQIVVDTDYVLKKMLDPNVIIVDANLSSWYHGGFLAYSKRGHIPRAINAPYPFYFREDKCWKNKEDLGNYFKAIGIVPEKEIIVYCGGNPAGSCLYFTLRNILNYPNVKFYYKSLIGWLSDERNLPVATYGCENLIRDVEWVRWFAGERIQYLVSDPKVRTIDARNKDEYRKEHIPFAVNIPIEFLFKKWGLQFEQWEKILGDNGIDQETEAVIYDEYVSPRSSLLFWLMEYLGHKKISILNGGLTSWMKNGFRVSNSDTIIAMPRHKFDIAISPKIYKIESLNKKIIYYEDIDSCRRSSIFLVCTKEDILFLTSKNVEVIKQIPWQDYIDSSGSFKKAGDLATIFESKQIYKHNEIICYSKSIAESTFSYFVLRLMGYPNVRVLFTKMQDS